MINVFVNYIREIFILFRSQCKVKRKRDRDSNMLPLVLSSFFFFLLPKLKINA